MVDRPRPHQRLGGAEELLHVDQVAVAQDRLQGRDPGIGAQYEQAVIARLLGQLAGINLEGLLGGGAEVVACEKGRLGAQTGVGVERPRFGWSKRATQRRTRKALSQARRSRRLWPAAARMALIASP